MFYPAGYRLTQGRITFGLALQPHTSPELINVLFPDLYLWFQDLCSQRFATANAVSSADDTKTTPSPTDSPIARAK